MPTGIYIRTPEMKTGKYKHTPEMKTGKYKHTEEHRKNQSESHKGLKQLPETIEKRVSKLRGKKHTKEHNEKIGQSNKGHHKSRNKGKKRTEEQNKRQSERIITEKTRKKQSESHKGEKHYNWKGGITPENHKIRNGIEFRLWREAVFARDNWICQKTGIKGEKLHPHHIKNFSQYPELRFAIDNGITLSEESHREFHKIYGIKNNNQKQVEEFLM